MEAVARATTEVRFAVTVQVRELNGAPKLGAAPAVRIAGMRIPDRGGTERSSVGERTNDARAAAAADVCTPIAVDVWEAEGCPMARGVPGVRIAEGRTP